MISYFILPVHNKEYLIVDVLQGIIDSCKTDFHIICIIDGCTDASEELIKQYVANNKLENKLSLYFMNDVHEITCINYGLSIIKMMNPGDEDLIFTVQDDVILQEPNIDLKFHNLFNTYQDLGYVSMRLGSNIVSIDNSIGETNYIESEFGHWTQLGLNHFYKVKHGQFVESQLAIRSPTCVLWKRYKEIGFYDAALAPFGYDCHDFSIRTINHGYKNGVYAMKFKSDVKWGGMRTTIESDINKKTGVVYERNRAYLAFKHRTFLHNNA